MSGKKRGEVKTVLKDASKIRKDTFTRNISEIMEGLSQLQNEECSLTEEKMKLKSLEADLKETDERIEKLERLIEKKTGDHYFNDEYNQATELQEHYKHLDKAFKTLHRGLQKKNEAIIEEKIKKLRQQKKAAQEKMDSITSTLERIKYKDPRNPSKILSLKEFSSQILNQQNLYSGISHGLQKSKELFSDEKYVDSVEALNRVDYEIQKLRENLDEREIEIREMITTGLAYQTALRDAGYSILTRWKNSDGITEGLVIEATVPQPIAATITNSGGAIEVQLNTPDNEGCVSSIEEISNTLRANGLDFNVTHWGSADRAKSKPQSQKQQERELKK